MRVGPSQFRRPIIGSHCFVFVGIMWVTINDIRLFEVLGCICLFLIVAVDLFLLRGRPKLTFLRTFAKRLVASPSGFDRVNDVKPVCL